MRFKLNPMRNAPKIEDRDQSETPKGSPGCIQDDAVDELEGYQYLLAATVQARAYPRTCRPRINMSWTYGPTYLLAMLRVRGILVPW